MANEKYAVDYLVRISKLFEICARELALNNQLKMIEDAREGVFNGDVEFNKFVTDLIANDLKIINGGSDNV